MAFLLAVTAGTLLFCWLLANGTATAIVTPLNYYLPYYDNSSPNFNTDNLVLSNLSSNDAPVVVSIAGVDVYSPTVPAASSVVYSSDPGTAGGPVKVSSLNGDQLLVSHRYAYGDVYGNAGETYAIAETDLDSTYYMSWYDNSSPGVSTNIELANPDSAAEWAYADVYIAGNLKGEYPLPPGGHTSVSYPGVMGGPVKVVTNGPPIVAGERTIFGASFAEVMGVPQSGLSSHYFYTSYDNSTSGYAEWVLSENPGSSSVYYEVRIGNNPSPLASGTIDPGAMTTPTFPGVKNGPVEVQAWTDSSKSTPANILSSCRYLHGGGFGEETGTPVEAVSGEYDLSRHDTAPATITDETLLANISDSTSTADVYIGSSAMAVYTATIPAHSMFGPLPTSLPSGGPVRVISREGNNIIAHQDMDSAGPPAPLGPSNAYFPWYDTIAGSTWLLAAQPAGSGDNVVDFFMKTSPLQQGINVPDGTTYPNLYPGQMGGPIKVSSQNSTGISSERSLFGNSFEEIWSTSYGDLDSHYYWPVYIGGLTPEWVLISNPAENGEPVAVDVTIRHVEDAQRNPQPDIQVHGQVIQPGDTWTPSWPRIGDAVEVRAYRVGGSAGNTADARKVITSERILVNGAFNEMAGIPASTMTNDYEWTWYDNLSPNSDDMLGIGNPNGSPVNLFIYLHGQLIAYTDPAHPLSAGETTAWDSIAGSNPHPLMDGPIEVKACFDSSPSCTSPANIYTSQIVFFGPSYEETAGIPLNSLKPTSNWTWYDESSRASANWVLVANPNGSSIYYEISIPGQLAPTNPKAHGILAPGDRVTPDFPGIMGGPVQVRAWTDSSKTMPANVMASQRVLWNGYFNEVVGKGM